MSGLLKGIWRGLPKEIKKEKLQRGDYIYTLTQANTKYSAIYLDDENVINFPQGRQGSWLDDHSTCPKCGGRDQSSFHGVVSSCIDCFLSVGGHLYLFEYGVNPAYFLAKLGGGTTLASSDPAEVVQNRVSNFLVINNNDSGDHYRFINNGADFAMYCKTGFVVIDNINFSRSWQTAFFFAVTFITVFLFLQQLTTATFPGLAARCFGLYCFYRFGSDIAVRPNIIKVDQVQTLPDVDEKLSSTGSGFRPIQSLIDLFIALLMAHFSFQLLIRVMWSDTLQLQSETPRGVLTLACIIFSYSAILQRRLLSNKIHKKQLKPGDHIYTWRRKSCGIYAHHGIYAGDSDKEVINLVRGGDHILSSSASSDTTISTGADAGNKPTKCRVEFCSLDSFLNGGELYLYKYGVSLAFFIAKTRGGTCTLGSADPPKSVCYRARQELKGIGAYNLFSNNCEDFAIYCKTGLRSRKGIIDLGRNGQIASYISAVCAIIIFIFTFRSSNPIGVAATVYFIYSMLRFVADATHCEKAYQVRLKTLSFWRRGRFPVFVPQFMYLGDKEKEILRF